MEEYGTLSKVEALLRQHAGNKTHDDDDDAGDNNSNCAHLFRSGVHMPQTKEAIKEVLATVKGAEHCDVCDQELDWRTFR